MEELIINPENYEGEYIQNLNKCFNGWGDEAAYEWFFDRRVGSHSSDLILIKNDESGVIAGSGVSYRTLKFNDKPGQVEIGIMTGSWTLPAARGQGCFSKIIKASKEICKSKEVPFLTAFVTETNASYRRLESAGSFLLPTYHLFSPHELFVQNPEQDVKVVEETEPILQNIFDTFLQRQSPFARFDYNKEEFFGQYINRVKNTTLLKIKDDYAVIENGKNEIKILLLTYPNNEAFKLYIQLISDWCIKNRSKKAFFFTTRKELYKICVELGFENVPGYFTILSSKDEEIPYREIFDSLNINMGDKM